MFPHLETKCGECPLILCFEFQKPWGSNVPWNKKSHRRQKAWVFFLFFERESCASAPSWAKNEDQSSEQSILLGIYIFGPEARPEIAGTPQCQKSVIDCRKTGRDLKETTTMTFWNMRGWCGELAKSCYSTISDARASPNRCFSKSTKAERLWNLPICWATFAQRNLSSYIFHPFFHGMWKLHKIAIPSGNQTWQWKIAELNTGFKSVKIAGNFIKLMPWPWWLTYDEKRVILTSQKRWRLHQLKMS